MLVNLKKPWFDPSGTYRKPEDNPHDVSDEFEDKLPSSAEKLSAKEVKEVKKAEKAEEEEK